MSCERDMTETDMRKFTRNKFFWSLGHKKNFGLI